MAMPDLEQENREVIHRDRTSRKIQIGMKSDGTPLYIRVSDDGYLITKLMGLDTETTNEDVQIAVDAQGRLLINLADAHITADLEIDTDALEQEILDTLLHYRMVDHTIVSGVLYMGFLEKTGKWYIEAYTIATGNSLFVKGDSGYTFAAPAGLSYASFSATF